jgi:hypothetical protein
MVTLDAPLPKWDMHDVCLRAMEELARKVPGNEGQMELARRLEDLNHAVIYGNPLVQSDRTERLYALLRQETEAGNSWTKMQTGIALIRDRLRSTIRSEEDRLPLFHLCGRFFDVTI